MFAIVRRHVVSIVGVAARPHQGFKKTVPLQVVHASSSIGLGNECSVQYGLDGSRAATPSAMNSSVL